MSRRDTILRSAVLVLAERGADALTHRAVDARAGLALGSTSNLFRTRDALVSAIIEHIAAVDEALVRRALTQRGTAVSIDGLADALTAFNDLSTTVEAATTRARFALLFSATDAGPIVSARRAIAERAVATLAAAGHPDAEDAIRLALAFLDGVAISALHLKQPVASSQVRETLQEIVRRLP